VDASASDAVFSPDGRIFATADSTANYENAIRLWDAVTGKSLGACIGHKQAVRSIAYSPDGKTLASSSDDSSLKLWNVETLQELLTIHLDDGPVSNLRFSPDGTLLATASGSVSKPHTIRLFHAPTPDQADPALEDPILSNNPSAPTR
jgi:WD40 repeat protein